MNNQFELISPDTVLDIPPEVAICPYCDAHLYVQFTGGQEQEDGTWAADEILLECEGEPDMEEGDSWDDWLDQHSVMPYVYWLPVSKKVKAWINKRYRFQMD